jgi:hypothetical protein
VKSARRAPQWTDRLWTSVPWSAVDPGHVTLTKSSLVFTGVRGPTPLVSRTAIGLITVTTVFLLLQSLQNVKMTTTIDLLPTTQQSAASNKMMGKCASNIAEMKKHVAIVSETNLIVVNRLHQKDLKVLVTSIITATILIECRILASTEKSNQN